MTEREDFIKCLEHMEAGFRKQSPTITREEMLIAIAFALFQESRRTTPDREDSDES